MTDEHTPTPAPASSSTGWPNAGSAPPRPHGVATTAAMSMAVPRRSIAPGPPSLAIRWLITMYSMNSAQFAKAKTNPSGCPVTRIAVMAATPAVTCSPRTARRRSVRAVRAPPAVPLTLLLREVDHADGIPRKRYIRWS